MNKITSGSNITNTFFMQKAASIGRAKAQKPKTEVQPQENNVEEDEVSLLSCLKPSLTEQTDSSPKDKKTVQQETSKPEEFLTSDDTFTDNKSLFIMSPLSENEEKAVTGILDKLSTVYPGLTQRVNTLHSQACSCGYTKEGAEEIESCISQQKPWSTREFDAGRLKDHIETKKANHPELTGADVDKHYDMASTLKAKNKMMSELEWMFPQDKYPGVSFAGRVKSKESLKNKIETKQSQGKDYSLADATDLVGVRVVADKLEQVEGITKAIEEKYGDNILEKSNYYETPNGAYKAIHYIVDKDGVTSEIQVSTKNMRVAFDAFHDTVYKESPDQPLTPSMKEYFTQLVSEAIYMDGREFLSQDNAPKP